jgi:hypothetical protein
VRLDDEARRPWLCDLRAEGTVGESPAGSILIIALKADVTVHRLETALCTALDGDPK